MIKEATATGATVEEAQENALAKLNAKEEENVKFEVLNMPKKKVLGLFGGNDAEVRAWIELPDAEPAKKSTKTDDKKSSRPEKKPAPADSAKKENPTAADEDYKNAVDAATLSPDSPAARAVEFIKGILTGFNCEIPAIKVAEKENGALIILEGEGLGAIIGRRGETLDALQYLTGLAANNDNGYYKISLNIGDYRQKREQTLTELANRVSAQVLRSGRSRVLEPMNPYERRIIHTAVQAIEGVVSNSFGEGKARRVVIAPEGGDTRPPRRDSYNRGRNGRGGHDRMDCRPSNTVSTTPTREPKKDSDRPLYGKIN